MTDIFTKVEYTVISEYEATKDMLAKLATYDILALDIEVAGRYSKEYVQLLKKTAPLAKGNHVYTLDSKIKATGLSHSSHTLITHIQFAWSSTESVVFVMVDEKVLYEVLNFVVSTESKLLIHKATFDLKVIYYHTKMFPRNYEDTQLYTRCKTNHVDVYKAKAGLKELMGYRYGAWALTKEDNFTIETIYDEGMLKYSAIDPCATFALWELLEESKNEI